MRREKKYGKSQLEYERNAILAVSSIYGIEILPDNVKDCRIRLFDVFNDKYTRLFKKKAHEKCRNTVRFILERNVVWGDVLSLKTGGDDLQPIVFSDWAFPFHDSRVKRREWIFADLTPPENARSPDLFSGPELVSDLGEKTFFPKLLREFRPVHYLKIGVDNE